MNFNYYDCKVSINDSINKINQTKQKIKNNLTDALSKVDAYVYQRGLGANHYIDVSTQLLEFDFIQDTANVYVKDFNDKDREICIGNIAIAVFSDLESDWVERSSSQIYTDITKAFEHYLSSFTQSGHSKPSNRSEIYCNESISN